MAGGEKVKYSDDEYTTKELREMIGNIRVQVSASDSKLDTIIKNQEHYMRNCESCKAHFTEEISDLKTDMAVYKTKVGIIIAGIGFVATVLASILLWILNHLPSIPFLKS